MKIAFIEPNQEIKPYIESLWVFDSPVGFPAGDSSVAAPNGCAKLIIPYQNSLVSTVKGASSNSHPGKLYFVGNQDSSTQLQSTNQATGFIAIEFAPAGAFPIFGIPMAETAGRLWETEQLLETWSQNARAELMNEPRVDRKVQIVQRALFRLLQRNGVRNAIVEHCVRKLKATNGLLTIKALSQDTGYSRRHLSNLFREYIGLSPKKLAEIFRFQHYHRLWAERRPYESIRDALYQHYYDESHFHKEFRKMTGHTPSHYRRNVSNEFGRIITLR
jgi:AraC-like DNA-binding protein